MSRMPRALPLLGALLLASATASAAPDGGTGPAADGGAQDDAELQRELEGALRQDAKAAPEQGRGAASQSPAGAPAEATQGATPPPVARGAQSLNPDISGILDANAGAEGRTPAFRNGDDPALRSSPTAAAAGFAVQEVELALSAIVDPYFKGEIYLTIPNLNGLEVEEAFATTTSLPGNLQVKAGSFRSAFGRQNGQHLHIQDFTRRPLINAAFLGGDGLRGPGAQVSWLSPLPFYLTLSAEAFSLGPPDADAPVASFGGGRGTDLTWVGEAKAFFPFGDDWSVYAGLSGATGVSPNSRLQSPAAPGAVALANRRSVLFGGDLYVKWKPPNVSAGYQSVAWQSEIIVRRLGDGAATLAGPAATAVPAEWDSGLYSQVVYQFARRWFLGVRGDALGLPASSAVPPTLRGAVSLTFQASEFARVRAYGELEHVGDARPVPGYGYTLAPDSLALADPRSSAAAYLQLEISIGAHGAHPF